MGNTPMRTKRSLVAGSATMTWTAPTAATRRNVALVTLATGVVTIVALAAAGGAASNWQLHQG